MSDEKVGWHVTAHEQVTVYDVEKRTWLEDGLMASPIRENYHEGERSALVCAIQFQTESVEQAQFRLDTLCGMLADLEDES